jgi:hypothetical protein
LVKRAAIAISTNHTIMMYQRFATKITHNRANTAATIALIVCTLFSKSLLLKAGAEPVNIIPDAAKNAINCRFELSDISNQDGIRNKTMLIIMIGNKILLHSFFAL